MVRATRIAFLLFFIVWLNACEKDPGNGPRATFADGSSGATSDATLSGESEIDCQAASSTAEVVSGASFTVNVVFLNGTAPFQIAGFASGITSRTTSVVGQVTLTGGSDLRVTRRLVIQDAAGLKGSCSFQVVVRH